MVRSPLPVDTTRYLHTQAALPLWLTIYLCTYNSPVSPMPFLPFPPLSFIPSSPISFNLLNHLIYLFSDHAIISIYAVISFFLFHFSCFPPLETTAHVLVLCPFFTTSFLWRFIFSFTCLTYSTMSSSLFIYHLSPPFKREHAHFQVYIVIGLYWNIFALA